MKTELKGLTNEEASALRALFALTPWKRDKVSKAVGKFLDGDETALDATPNLKKRVTEISDTLQAALQVHENDGN